MTKPTHHANLSGISKSAQVRALLAADMKPADIAKEVGCSMNLVYVVKSNSGGDTARKRRGPGRAPKVAANTGMHGLEGIVAAVKNSERERAAMRAALEKIRLLASSALA
jgi:hypothetical protein